MQQVQLQVAAEGTRYNQQRKSRQIRLWQGLRSAPEGYEGKDEKSGDASERSGIGVGQGVDEEERELGTERRLLAELDSDEEEISRDEAHPFSDFDDGAHLSVPLFLSLSLLACFLLPF